MISSLEALAPWFSTGFLRRKARSSLNNSKDQWSDVVRSYTILLYCIKILGGSRNYIAISFYTFLKKTVCKNLQLNVEFR